MWAMKRADGTEECHTLLLRKRAAATIGGIRATRRPVVVQAKSYMCAITFTLGSRPARTESEPSVLPLDSPSVHSVDGSYHRFCKYSHTSHIWLVAFKYLSILT